MSTRVIGGGWGLKHRAGLLAAALVIAGGVYFVLMAPGLAAADSTQCGYGSSQGNVQTCVDVGGTSVSTSATDVSSGRMLQSCLHINGVRVECTPYTYVPPGGGIGNTWIPGGEVPSGTYCAVTWKENPDGSTTELDSECIGVTNIG